MNNKKYLNIYVIHFLILLLGLCSLGAVNAQTKSMQKQSSLFSKSTDRDFKANIGFKGLKVDNLQNQTNSFGFNTDLLFRQNLTPSLAADINAGLNLETGSNKSVRQEEFKPSQGIYLGHALLDYTPNANINLQVGAINQSFLNNPLFVTSTAFIGAKEKISFKNINQEYYLEAEQAIPNNHTLANRLGQVDEGTPNFLLGTAGININGNFVSLKANISAFQFRNLSNSVANESRLMGNSIKGNSSATAKYIYGFSGLNTGYTLNMNLGKGYKLSNTTQYLFNQDAPDGRNTGYLTRVGFGIDTVTFFSELFHNESDTSPSFYNDKNYGHNNRKGYAVGTKMHWPQYDLTFNAKYIKANVIEENSYQSDSNVILLNLMRAYDF